MLTKEILEKVYELRIEIDPNEKSGYSIYHWAVKGGPCKNGTFYWKKLNVHTIFGKHKYAKNLDYYSIGFSCKNLSKFVTLTLQRAVYAWFKGDIPDGCEIDHIDCNRLNNSLDNLRCLSVRDNRVNKKKQSNQWTYITPEQARLEKEKKQCL